MEIELLIPNNINVDALIPENLKGEAREKFHDRIVYFLHIIVARLNTKKVFEEYLNNGYVRLMKKYLRQIMGNQTKDIIDILSIKKIITVDLDYEIGEYSMGYILTDKYLKAKPKKVQLISYEVFKVYKRKLEEQRKLQKKLSSKIPQVIVQLSKPWSIDLPKAVKWTIMFESMFYNQINESKIIPAENKLEAINKYKQYYQFIRRQLVRIEQGNVSDYTIDEKAGRLHTIFTGLPRPLKNFLRYQVDQSLACIDIKNSQPFLLGYMMTLRFWKTTQESRASDRAREELTLMKVGKEVYNKIMDKYDKKRARAAIIMMLETPETIDRSEFPGIHLQCLCSEGKFYEYIMDKFNGIYLAGGIDRFGTRNETKREVMRIMYFDTRKEKAPFYAPFKQFAQLFPIESKIMRLIKSCGFREFPILLQRIESKLMLEKVGEKIPKHIPFLTVHDSIIIPEIEVPATIKLIESEFKFYLDLTPKISEPDVLNTDKGFEALDSYVKEKLNNLEIKFLNKQKLSTNDIMGGDEIEGYSLHYS